MWKSIICFVYSPKYVIHFYTGQPQVTAKDSADGVLGDIAAAGATAAWNIAYFVLDGCGLTHAGADLQGFGNFGDWAGPLFASKSGLVSNGRPTNAESRARTAAACPNKTRIKSKKATVKLILGRINAPRLPNGRYQKLQPLALPERSASACPSLTTCSPAVAATWMSSLDATSTTPMMSGSSTTHSSSDLT